MCVILFVVINRAVNKSKPYRQPLPKVLKVVSVTVPCKIF